MKPPFARKRFGQHFLVERRVIEEIMRVIAPQRSDRVVEIGPGRGALTRPLLAAVDRLTAIEIDRDLSAYLQTHFSERLQLYTADILNFDLTELIEQPAKSDRVLRMIGNLPYNISTPLLFHLTHFTPLIVDQHFMVQREVAERIVASPGSKVYGRLSVMLQYYYCVEILLTSPACSFQPMPKVESAFIRMVPRSPMTLSRVDPGVLAKVVNTAFAHRRKMLLHTLRCYRDVVDFAALGIDLSQRAEQLTLEQYSMLAQQLMNAEK